MRGTASPISGFCSSSVRQFALGLVFPQAVRFRCAEDGAPYAAPRLKPRPVHRFAWTALTGGHPQPPEEIQQDTKVSYFSVSDDAFFEDLWRAETKSAALGFPVNTFMAASFAGSRCSFFPKIASIAGATRS